MDILAKVAQKDGVRRERSETARSIGVSSAVVLLLSTLTANEIAFASEIKSSGSAGGSSGSGSDSQYSIDSATSIVLKGQQTNLKDSMGLPTDIGSEFTTACSFFGATNISNSLCKDPAAGAKKFEAAAKTFGVPAAYLMCMTGLESGFVANKPSADGKSNGLVQFTRDTATAYAQEFSKNQNNYQAAWKAFQSNGGTTRDPSVVTQKAIISADLNDADVGIFAMGMYARDALDTANKASKLDDKKSSLDLLNYIIVSYNAGQGNGQKFLNANFNVSSLNTDGEKKNTLPYIKKVDDCITKITNGKTRGSAALDGPRSVFEYVLASMGLFIDSPSQETDGQET